MMKFVSVIVSSVAQIVKNIYMSHSFLSSLYSTDEEKTCLLDT